MTKLKIKDCCVLSFKLTILVWIRVIYNMDFIILKIYIPPINKIDYLPIFISSLFSLLKKDTIKEWTN